MRYASPNDMLKAMKTRHSTRSTLVTGVAAAAIALLGLGLFTELLPNQEAVEFVEAAPKEDFGEEMYPDEFDPSMLVEVEEPDTVATQVDEKEMKVFEAKAEQIFRKRYAAEADRILSKIYDKEHMNVSEKKFLSESTAVMAELAKKQMELGEEAGLNDTKSQRIASEIIERITNQKKAMLEQQQKEAQE